MHKDSGSMGSWDYLDFELEVREGGPREYPLTVRSPAGEAQAEMRFPFDEWELKDRLQALEIALLRSGGTRRRIPSPEEHTVQDFGRGLFESILVGDVRTRYEMSLSEARRQGKGLRLKLRIHPPELAVLPWEFLYDAERDRYPSLSSNTPLVRYLDLPQPVEPLRVSPPLRILGMVTSPLGLDPLDVGHEKRLVEEAIRGLRENGLLELTWLEGQTWRDLQRAMRRGPWHIFHFVGHGGFDPATEEGAIALADEAGHKRLLRATSLAELLDDHYPLRLMFLNSCEGARGSESDAFSSTAATLVRRGIPAVVAMQYEITDKAAIEFSRDFYDAVADGLPVDAAVTEARAAVSMDSMLEWGTPVLYMRSSDGRIFDVSAQASRARITSEAEAWQQGEPHPVVEENERRKQLQNLYAQARRSHQAESWQAVIEVFDQIRATDPAYPDPEGLLMSAREALEAQELSRRTDAIYEEGLQHMEIGEWRQALHSFEEVRRLKPGYREVETLLVQARREVSDRTSEHTDEAEDDQRQTAQHSATSPVEQTEETHQPQRERPPSRPASRRQASFWVIALSTSVLTALLTVLFGNSPWFYWLPLLGIAAQFLATSIVSYIRPISSMMNGAFVRRAPFIIDWVWAAFFVALTYVPFVIASIGTLAAGENQADDIGSWLGKNLYGDEPESCYPDPETFKEDCTVYSVRMNDVFNAIFFFFYLPNVLIVSVASYISYRQRRRRPNANA
jgi:hypothetical protein